MSKILLVEDDADLAENIRDWLIGEQYFVDLIEQGKDALSMAQMQQYDLVILDWGLPDMTGIEVMKLLRSRGGNMPILMLTGKKTVEEKEKGLDSGADDYLVKPIELRELSARIRALLRRPVAVASKTLSVGGISLDPSTFRVSRNGEEIVLQPKEFALLKFLMEHPNQVFGAEAIITRLWPTETEVSADVVRKHINKIRGKLDLEGRPSIIRTIHGVGYCVENS